MNKIPWFAIFVWRVDLARNQDHNINLFPNVYRHRCIILVDTVKRLRGPIIQTYHAWVTPISTRMTRSNIATMRWVRFGHIYGMTLFLWTLMVLRLKSMNMPLLLSRGGANLNNPFITASLTYLSDYRLIVNENWLLKISANPINCRLFIQRWIVIRRIKILIISRTRQIILG